MADTIYNLANGPSTLPVLYRDNGDGTFSLSVSDGGGGSGGVDRELVVSTYRVKTAFAGASVGDTVTATQIIDVSGATPATLSTIWRNQTTATDFAVAPGAVNLELVGSQALTDAQLRATALPLPTGAATAALQTALNSSVGQPSDDPATTDTGTFSLIALTKRWLEQITNLTGKLPETLGQKAKSASLSVVVATDQPTLPTQAYMPPVPIAGQGKIATTGTAQALQNLPLKNGIVVTARDENSSAIWVGSSDVTSTDDGAGKGYRLTPGQSISFAVENANSVYLIGSAGQIFYYAGN